MSALSITKMLYKEKGIFGVYKGMGATAVRDITFSAIYFPLFANLNAWVS
jgi:solute carrier family 25 glutamate transporter 18/22